MSGSSVLIMKTVCSRSVTVRMLGQHRPDAVLFNKENQRFLEGWLHNSLSGRPQLAFRRSLEKIISESI
jgi:hypothetical protein